MVQARHHTSAQMHGVLEAWKSIRLCTRGELTPSGEHP